MPILALCEPLSLPRASKLHLQEMEVRGYARSVLDQAESVLFRFALHLREQGIADLRGVREEHVVAFAGHLQASRTRQGTPLSPSTRSWYLTILRRFFARLVQRGMLLTSPAAHLILPKVDKLPRAVLSMTEAGRLVESPPAHTALGKRDRAILEMLYGTGIRRGECLRLDLGDVDLLQRQVLVRNGKGKEDRLMPLPRRTAAALDLYLRQIRPALVHHLREPAVFLTLFGRRMSSSTLDQLVRRHARGAGLERGVSPHALRHAYATHLLKRGADVRHIQRLLGHHRIDTTARYTRVEVGDLREVLARAHPREKPRTNG